MKKLLLIGALCFILLGSPAVSLAQTLTISQLQAIVASLQAQLNALITQLNLIQQQENNSKPIVKPIESIKPLIVVKSPQRGDTWYQGKSYTISWTAFKGDFDAYNVLIGNYLVPGVKGGLPGNARVSSSKTSVSFDPRDLSDNYIKTWIINASSYGLDVSERDLRRNFYYTIQAVQDLPNGKEKIIASGEGGKFSILKNNDDEIAALPTIEMLSPNGGESYKQDTEINITWQVKNQGDLKTQIDLLTNEGVLYKNIVTGIPPDLANLNYRWTPFSTSGCCGKESTPSGKYKIRVSLIDPDSYNPQVVDESNVAFTIVSAESVPSRNATINVKVLKGGIYCIKAPCEFPLAGAEVSLYNSSKVLVGTKVVDTTGTASFSVAPGTYTAISRASGYVNTTNTIGVVVGQSVAIKTVLMVSPAPTSQLNTNPDLASVLQSLQGVLQGLSGSLSH